MIEKELWQKAKSFHGHVCPGLTIGFKASLLAIKLLDINFSDDEQLVCVTENDACGVDAIQAILGCSVGKGNLIFKLRGKQAFSFYNRKTGKSVRLVYIGDITGANKDEIREKMFDMKPEDLFDVKQTNFELPERAKLFNNIVCEKCKESTAESYIKIQNGKKVCPDCFDEYKRFF